MAGALNSSGALEGRQAWCDCNRRREACVSPETVLRREPVTLKAAPPIPEPTDPLRTWSKSRGNSSRLETARLPQGGALPGRRQADTAQRSTAQRSTVQEEQIDLCVFDTLWPVQTAASCINGGQHLLEWAIQRLGRSKIVVPSRAAERSLAARSNRGH